MDAIRLRQIDEALSYDRNINAMVFDIEKKRAARYPETEVIPDSQTDEDMEATSTEQVNALRVILDNKYANLLGMIRPGVKIDSDQFTYASRETSQVETVVQSYNSAVAPYTSSKIQMFKQRLLYKLQELLGPVGLIRNGLMKLITSIVRKMARNDDGLRPTLSFYFVRCVEVLAVYDLMYEYIKSGKLIQITSGDVQARISELLQGRPNWRSVANHDDVNSLFREFDFSSGGTDNGGEPPGPLLGGSRASIQALLSILDNHHQDHHRDHQDNHQDHQDNHQDHRHLHQTNKEYSAGGRLEENPQKLALIHQTTYNLLLLLLKAHKIL
jgi:hypothetical protein